MEKILKRPDGSRVKIRVNITTGYTAPLRNLDVETCAQGKRSFLGVVDTSSHVYRNLSLEDRVMFRLKYQLEHATVEEINSVIREAVEEIYDKVKL